jgi:hypothetical protein
VRVKGVAQLPLYDIGLRIVTNQHIPGFVQKILDGAASSWKLFCQASTLDIKLPISYLNFHVERQEIGKILPYRTQSTGIVFGPCMYNVLHKKLLLARDYSVVMSLSIVLASGKAKAMPQLNP